MAKQDLSFDIGGLDCPNCAADLEKAIAAMEGVERADLNFTLARLHVQGDVGADAVIKQVAAAGHTAALAGDPAGQRKHAARPGGVLGFILYLLERFETRAALGGGLLIAAALAARVLGAPHTLIDVLLLLALAVAGYPIARSGLRALVKNRTANINLLMSIAAVGAVFIGELSEGAMVIFLFAIGEALEGYTADRARDSIRGLVSLVPQRATVQQPDGREAVVDVTEVAVGAVVVVKPGERVPVDGRVTAGTSAVNQAPITGESMPVPKSPGAEVFAGTINGEGALRVEVTRPAGDSTLQQVIRLVEEAQSQQAPVQRFVDRFAQWYTPAVVALAAMVAVLPPLLLGAPFYDTGDAHGWLYRALALLVIACPCALVISTPVAMVSATAGAARRGVLVKGGAHMEALGRVKAFAFDKTGTLTEGRPHVTGYRAAECVNCDGCRPCGEMLSLAAAVERHSEHPIAQAVVGEASHRALASAPAEAVEALAGRGVRGRVNGKTVTVGSRAFFHEQFARDPVFCERVQSLEAEGQTVMLVGEDDRVRGYISVADRVRPSSREALAALKAMGGVEAAVMLTGDNRAVAETVGAAVGVDAVRAGLLPQDKVEAVRGIAAQYGSVAMVGDGINDAPALAAATVGIAMGGAGSAQALETADVALMAGDLAQLPYAVGLSRMTSRVIGQNITFSLGIKLVFMALALMGVATMWMAVFADVGTSLLVTLNGMRPLAYKR